MLYLSVFCLLGLKLKVPSRVPLKLSGLAGWTLAIFSQFLLEAATSSCTLLHLHTFNPTGLELWVPSNWRLYLLLSVRRTNHRFSS